MRYVLIAIAFIMLTTGCDGLTFDEAQINESLPEIIQNRCIYPHGLGYHMNLLAGGVFILDQDGNLNRISTCLPDDLTQPEFEPIENPVFVYHSLIYKTSHTGIDGLGLVFDLVSDGLSEIEIFDDCIASIYGYKELNYPNIVQLAKDWVITNPRDPAMPEQRIWIHSVVIMRYTLSKYTEIDANASGVLGPAIGINAGTFKRLENETHSVIVAYDAYDIDALAGFSGRDTTYSRMDIDQARFDGIFEGIIRDPGIEGR